MNNTSDQIWDERTVKLQLIFQKKEGGRCVIPQVNCWIGKSCYSEYSNSVLNMLLERKNLPQYKSKGYKKLNRIE